MTERWMSIDGWEGAYEVSDLGRVRSVERKVWNPRGRGFYTTVPSRILRGSPVQSGHEQVALSRGNARVMKQVHRLVLEAFAGPCPEGMEGCHNDGNPTNNALTNLRWDTRSANQRDAVAHGAHGSTKKTRCPKGHPYDAENTGRSNKRRYCRECGKEHNRRWRAKHIDPPADSETEGTAA